MFFYCFGHFCLFALVELQLHVLFVLFLDYFLSLFAAFLNYFSRVLHNNKNVVTVSITTQITCYVRRCSLKQTQKHVGFPWLCFRRAKAVYGQIFPLNLRCRVVLFNVISTASTTRCVLSQTWLICCGRFDVLFWYSLPSDKWSDSVVASNTGHTWTLSRSAYVCSFAPKS